MTQGVQNERSMFVGKAADKEEWKMCSVKSRKIKVTASVHEGGGKCPVSQGGPASMSDDVGATGISRCLKGLKRESSGPARHEGGIAGCRTARGAERAQRGCDPRAMPGAEGRAGFIAGFAAALAASWPSSTSLSASPWSPPPLLCTRHSFDRLSLAGLHLDLLISIHRGRQNSSEKSEPWSELDS